MAATALAATAACERLGPTTFFRLLLEQVESWSAGRSEPLAGAPLPPLDLVVYGVGGFERSLPARLQLACALALHRSPRFRGGALHLFDPVLSAVECAAAAQLGFALLAVNEEGKRRIAAPTVFFMPHCPMRLYSNVLWANWGAAALARLLLVGNSFEAYVDRAALDAAARADASNCVLRASAPAAGLRERRLTRTLPPDEADWLYAAFNDTSVHAWPAPPAAAPVGAAQDAQAAFWAARPPEFLPSLHAAGAGDAEFVSAAAATCGSGCC